MEEVGFDRSERCNSNNLVEAVTPNHPADSMAMDSDSTGSTVCDNACNEQEERGQANQAKDVEEPG